MADKYSPSSTHTLHTLGPTGTNCEEAAKEWFRRQGREGHIVLHDTLEDAVPHVARDLKSALLGCIAYPQLNTLMFDHIRDLELVECFVMPTFHMVLASRDGSMPRTVAMHPAPQALVADRFNKQFVNSNAAAAASCRKREADGCITTLPAAKANELRVIEDFGAVPMGFSIHVPLAR